MAFNVYHNPTTVLIGSTSITGVQSITVNVSYAEIHAAGDSDAHESVARFGTGRTSGTITLLDPTSASAVKDISGTLSFVFVDVKAATNKTFTVTSASIGGYTATAGRDSPSNCSLSWIAEALPSIA